jgi:type VI secretion system secreted protein VgrG
MPSSGFTTGNVMQQGTFSQEERRIAVYTPLGDDVLLLEKFTGFEGISRPFRFRLEMLSERTTIDFSELVRKGATVRMRLANGKERFVNGVIRQFTQRGRDTRFARYRAELVPSLWFLKLNRNCRIFQNKTVIEIIIDIFHQRGVKDYANHTIGSYQPREYCVQYRETDLEFVSRLMEEEGIFYYFQHDTNKHTLVLADSASEFRPCPTQPVARFETMGRVLEDERITAFEILQNVRTGSYALTDYNFETPQTSLLAEQPTIVAADSGSEIFDYPGRYLSKSRGEHLTRLRMEQEEAQHLQALGVSNCAGFLPGHRFALQDHYRADLNQNYVVTEVRHSADCGSAYYTGKAEDGDTYENKFRCIPRSIPYRPRRVTRRPVVQGPQTAIVVGPGGEEIYTDKYGRVKVQFFWDRKGQYNENSSCWIRVSQPWAGKSWGAVSIPRVGQEVVVNFLEGDPDMPIVAGRVYNADQMPPYGLPADADMMGFKSSSTQKSGGYNEIVIKDGRDGELIRIHAQKDMETTVLNNDTQYVKLDRKIQVDGKHHEAAKKEIVVVSTDDQIYIEAKTQITLKVGASTLCLDKDGNILLQGKYIKIQGSDLVDINPD